MATAVWAPQGNEFHVYFEFALLAFQYSFEYFIQKI